MNPICPYCRTPVDTQSENRLFCPQCGTPHHADCYEENKGCTVFGCAAAPADEPKIDLSAAALTTDATPVSEQPAPRTPAPPPPRAGQETPAPAPYRGTNSILAAPPVTWQSPPQAPSWTEEENAKKRGTFIALGALLGAFGAHNFYAGYTGKAIAQLVITVLTVGIAGPMIWIWAVVDICTVNRDARNVLMKG